MPTAEDKKNQSPWVVYILQCADNTLYTGITNNLEKRLKTHNAGKASRYTRARLPVEVIYFEAADDKSAALKREYEIKQLPRPEKLLLNNISNKDQNTTFKDPQ